MAVQELAAWRKQAAAAGADLRDTVAQLAEHAKAGSADASYLLAVFTAAGYGVGQDLKGALGHLQRAAEGGHRPAQTELAALVGNWRLARDVSAGKASRPETWGQLRAAVDVAGWLRIPDGRVFSEEPRIATVKGYLSAPACEWLIALGRTNLKAAQVYDAETGDLRSDSNRNNSAAQLDVERIDTLTAFVRARIAALANVSVAGLETSQILHYRVGEQFAEHCDFLDPGTPGHARDIAVHGQRALTVLIYLNDDYEGGDTAFPELGRSFKGRKGDALVFWNLTPEGAPDWRTRHIGTAPSRGEKWLFSQWIRIPLAAASGGG
ncbi:MAG TPA: 2OG-Fe(II) oxygenase [Burkholderiales bacterium]|nr:2OG-Fe(II) oxygenase [Burkholderiales bacterium]